MRHATIVLVLITLSPFAAPVSARTANTAKAAPVAAKISSSSKAGSASLAPRLSPIATVSTADPLQCRRSCAHAYYFCLAGDSAPACPETWTQCLSTCGVARIGP